MPSKLGEWLQMELAMLEQKLGQRALNDVHRLRATASLRQARPPKPNPWNTEGTVREGISLRHSSSI
jgi:hypothetical protein